MPWRAISIMPLLIAAPINTPIEATMIMRLKEAAFVPIAELRKFTASLLTPTDRSNTASRNRNTTTQRNNISIIMLFILVLCKGLFKTFHNCFKKVKQL